MVFYVLFFFQVLWIYVKALMLWANRSSALMANVFLDLKAHTGRWSVDVVRVYDLALKSDVPVKVTALQRSAAGGIPEKTGRSSVGVGFRYPVTMRNTSLIGLSSRCV